MTFELALFLSFPVAVGVFAQLFYSRILRGYRNKGGDPAGP